MPIPYPLPTNESARLQTVAEHGLLKMDSEASFDELTSLAAEICETPVALITILDEHRQWIKSRVGTDLTETPRDVAFCNYAICQEDILIVPDARADERFSANPLVMESPGIRFYAGMPLMSPEGHALGTLCVLDLQPRELQEHQQRALRVLSRHVCTLLELRLADRLRRQAEERLARTNIELERRVAERTAQMQVALRLAEEGKRQIASMVERMSDGMISFDREWRYEYVNQKAAELLGYDPVLLLGRRVAEVFPESVGSPVMLLLEQSVRDNRPLQEKIFFRRRSLWFECRCYPAAEGASLFLKDITATRKVEEDFRRERELSEAIIASLPGTFYFFDEEGRYLRWNEESEKTTGLSHQQYPLVPPVEKVALADRERLRQAMAGVFTTGKGSVEARLRHVSGEERWHLLTGRLLEVEGRSCIIGIGIDISDRKAAEEALAEASTRLELAVSAAGVGIWDWDVSTNQTYFSPDYKAQLGYADDEFPNQYQSWVSHMHPEDWPKVGLLERDFFAGPETEYQQEFRMRHKDGTYRWILSRARLYRGEGGRPLRMMGCHIDVTKRRQTELALHDTQKQIRALAQHQHSVREEEAGRIARELHDELGAALTALKIDVSWIDRRLAASACHGVGPMRQRITAIAEQLDATIASVRKVCQQLRPAVLDQLGIAEAIDWQVEDFETRTHVHCEVDRDTDLVLDDTASSAVFRILQELLTNVTRHADATEVKVCAFCQDGDFLLEVADNGIGLPEGALAYTDRFGLAGVRERALAVGGVVTFNPREGGGTVVRLTLPTKCQNEEDLP